MAWHCTRPCFVENPYRTALEGVEFSAEFDMDEYNTFVQYSFSTQRGPVQYHAIMYKILQINLMFSYRKLCSHCSRDLDDSNMSTGLCNCLVR